jgi:hypothetical protein
MKNVYYYIHYYYYYYYYYFLLHVSTPPGHLQGERLFTYKTAWVYLNLYHHKHQLITEQNPHESDPLFKLPYDA